jgi:uncharacterized protein with NAD-binding domain and iron-sulfur cluster
MSGLAPAGAAAARRRGRTVAIFGGGIAGLTAAHELAVRGFDVTVYERRAWGGKARSTDMPGSASGSRKPLPGEHGFRVWFGFYQNTVDTFRRIPYGANPHGVFDNLITGDVISFARDNGRRNLPVLVGGSHPAARSPSEVLDLLIGLLLQTDLPPNAVAFFAQRMAMFLSSCDARRLGEWDNTRWSEFAGANLFSEDYRKIIITFLSEFVQASKAETTSANFSAKVVEWFVYNLIGRNSNGPLIRSMNRPTNEAFIDPWLAELRRLGVRLHNHCELTGFDLRNGRITAAKVRTRDRLATIHADWYLCALPVERARRLWTPEIVAADPQLQAMTKLDTAWMNGMKFYLRKKTPMVKSGGVLCIDSPWLLAALTQAQFWPVDFASTYGDGRTHDCISIDICRWTQPGILYGRPASECSADEIAAEVWEQIKRHVNKPNQRPVLTDDLIVTWDIDEGMLRQGGRLISDDPLILPSAGQRPDRPDVTTAIPNLFLAGDYLKSSWEVANMETASYNARRAINALLRSAGSAASPAEAIEPYRPPEWEELKRIDANRYGRGQRNLFEAAPTDQLLTGPAGQLSDNALTDVRQLVARLTSL